MVWKQVGLGVQNLRLLAVGVIAFTLAATLLPELCTKVVGKRISGSDHQDDPEDTHTW